MHDLSHYSPMDPDVDRSYRKERLDAFPADDQATILLLKPGKGSLGLEPWHHFFDGSATVFLTFHRIKW